MQTYILKSNWWSEKADRVRHAMCEIGAMIHFLVWICLFSVFIGLLTFVIYAGNFIMGKRPDEDGRGVRERKMPRIGEVRIIPLYPLIVLFLVGLFFFPTILVGALQVMAISIILMGILVFVSGFGAIILMPLDFE